MHNKNFLIFFLFLFFFIPLASAAWWNNSYNSNQLVYNNNSAMILYVNVTYNSNMQVNFADIRFVGLDQSTSYNYHQEAALNGNWSTFRILTNGSNFYMYYGNSTVATLSNISNVYGFPKSFYYLDEASGAVLDAVAAYNGTANGAIQGYVGKVSTGYYFNGTETPMNVTISPTFNFASPTAISIWFNTSNINCSAKQIYYKGPSNTVNEYITINGAGTINYGFGAASGSNNVYTVSGFNFKNNTWYHVVVNGTGPGGTTTPYNNYSIYINGVNQTIVFTSIGANRNFPAGAANLYFGTGKAWGNAGIMNFTGTIDEVGVYPILVNGNITNLNSTSSNYTFGATLSLPSITLNLPANQATFNNLRNINLNFTTKSVTNSTFNCSINLNNYINATNLSVINNTLTNFLINGIPYGNNNWSINCTDNNGMTTSSIRFFWINDTIAPNINLNLPANNTIIRDIININFNFTSIDNQNLTSACYIYIDNILNTSNLSVINNTLTNFLINGIPYGNNNWSINCTDGLNSNVSEIRYFRILKSCVGANYNFTCGDTINESCTLNSNISYKTGSCFTIRTDNIVFDGNGYLIDTETGSTGFNIIIMADVVNITIKNGLFKGSLDDTESGASIWLGKTHWGDNNINIYNNTFYSDAGYYMKSGITSQQYGVYNNINIYNNTFNHLSYGIRLVDGWKNANVYNNNFTGNSQRDLDFYSTFYTTKDNITITNESLGNIHFNLENGINNLTFYNSNITSMTIINSNQFAPATFYYWNTTVNPPATPWYSQWKYWYVDSYVNDTLGNAKSNIPVTAYNVSNILVSNLTTNSSGYTPRTAMLEFYDDNGSRNYYSNYTFNATNGTAYTHDYPINLTTNRINSNKIILTIDTPPVIYFNPSSDANGIYNKSWIFVNITCGGVNINNVNLNWQGVNESFSNNIVNYYWSNKTFLPFGIYNFYAWCDDTYDYYNQTGTRIITLSNLIPVNVTKNCSDVLEVAYNNKNIPYVIVGEEC